MPGGGAITARSLIAEPPEPGRLAVLVGVTSVNRDSDAMRGHRAIAGGGAEVRNVLYMAALTASRRNAVIRNPYTRLHDRGRPDKAVFVAAVRKFLTTRNAIIRDGAP